VLETLKLLRKLGIWTEVVVLLVPTLNDSTQELGEMCRWLHGELGADVPVHFSRFWPTYKLRTIPSTPAGTLVRARQIAMAEGLNYVYIGNLAGHDAESTYCPKCKTRVIHRVRYTIVENLLADGRCPKCGQAIPGVW